MITHIVPASARETSLILYARRAWPLVPSHAWRELFKNRDARVNGARADERARVRAGDTVTLYLPDIYAPGALDILYEDGALCAFIKPRGLPVDADADGVGADTVLTRLIRMYDSAMLTHRLDAGTGGVMLAALDANTKAALERAFRERAIDKLYECAALGEFDWDEKLMKAYIIKSARDSKVTVLNRRAEGALSISTRFRVIERLRVKGAPVARVEAQLLTGRTHQIRAQLAHMGHPLLGDDKYGDREINKRLGKRDIMLWCKRVQINACEGLEKYEGMRFDAPPPDWRLI